MTHLLILNTAREARKQRKEKKDLTSKDKHKVSKSTTYKANMKVKDKSGKITYIYNN